MEDRCICCGGIIPEGRMVCPLCEAKADKTHSEQDVPRESIMKVLKRWIKSTFSSEKERMKKK